LKTFLFLVTAAFLNGGLSEPKVITLDKDLAKNIYVSMVPIHPVVLEKKYLAEMCLTTL
jgi:hypothetical protein